MAEESTSAEVEAPQGDPFAAYGGKPISQPSEKSSDDPFSKYGGRMLPKKQETPKTGNQFPTTAKDFQTSTTAPFSDITTTPKMQKQLQENAAHDNAIKVAQEQKQVRYGTLNNFDAAYNKAIAPKPQKADTKQESSIWDDISNALYLPAFNKGFNDLVVRPFLGASDLVGRGIDKAYTGITGEQTPSWLVGDNNKTIIGRYSKDLDQAYNQRKKPTNIVSEAAEGAVGAAPLVMSLFTGQGEASLAAKAPNFISRATKLLATTGAANAYKEATDNKEDFTSSLKSAATGATEGALQGLTMDAQMLLGGAMGKGVVNKLVEKGLLKGGKAGEALVHALATGTVFGGTPVVEDLLSGKDVDTHEALKQFGTGLMFEAIPVAKGLNDEIQGRRETKSINDQAAQAATLSTASSNLHGESVLRTLMETPKDQVEQIHQNIKTPHEDLYASSIEQGMKAFEENNPNEKRALLTDQLLLKTQGDVKYLSGRDNTELMQQVANSQELEPEQKNDLLEKLHAISKPNEQTTSTTEIPIEAQANEPGKAQEPATPTDETTKNNQITNPQSNEKGSENVNAQEGQKEERSANAEKGNEKGGENEKGVLVKSGEDQTKPDLIDVVKDKSALYKSTPIENLRKLGEAFKNRFGTNYKIIEPEEAQKILDSNHSKDVFFQILDDVDVFNSKNPSESKSFIDKVFQTVDNAAEAKSAYRKLAVKFHPDKGGHVEVMKYLNEVKDKYDTGKLSTSATDSDVSSARYDDFTKATEDFVRNQGAKNAQEFSQFKERQKEQQQKKRDILEKRDRAIKKFSDEIDQYRKQIKTEHDEAIRKVEKGNGFFSKKLTDSEKLVQKYEIGKKYRKADAEALERYKQGLETYHKLAFEATQRVDREYGVKFQKGEAGKVGAFYDKKTNTAYFINGLSLDTSVIHEMFSHPFINTIETEHPELFKNILNEAKNDKQVLEYVDKNYSGADDQTKDHEYIAAAIDLQAMGELKNKTLIQYINEFWNHVKNKISALVSTRVTDFDKNTSIKDLVDFILKTDEKLNLKPKGELQDATKEIKQQEGGEPKYPEGDKSRKIAKTGSGYSPVGTKKSKGKEKVAKLPLAEHSELNNILREDHGISIKDLKDEQQQERNNGSENTPETTTNAEVIQQPENDRIGNVGEDRPSQGVEEKQSRTGKSTFKRPDKSGKSEKTPSLTDEELNRKLELRKKFAGRFNDITNIPTLLADKEFREYAGLVFKEAAGDFKQFSKELLDNVGEKLREHLPQLFKDLGGKEEDIPKPDEKATYGTKNSITEELQQGLGLPPIEIPKDRTDDESLAAWKDGKRTPQEITEQLLDPDTNIYDKSITPNDEPIMREYIRQLGERTKELNKIKLHLQEKVDVGDEQAKFDKASVEQQINNHLDEYNNALNASKVGGNVWHKYGDERQKAIDDKGLILNAIERIKNIYGTDIPKDVKKQLDDFQKRHDELVAKNEALQEKIKGERAQEVFEKAKAKRTFIGSKKLSEAEFKTAKADILEALKKDWKKSFAKTYATLPGIPQLNALAPHISQLMKLYADRGISKLDDVIRNIHDDLKDDIDGITQDDVKDLIAGRYSQHRPLSDLQKQVNELRTQARNKVKIEDLEKGIVAKAKAKGEASPEVKALQKQVNELKKQVLNQYANLSADELKKQSVTIQKQIDKGEFAKQPVVKRRWETDPEWIKNNREKANLTFKLRKLEQEAMNSKKSKFMKMLDWDNRWGRRVIFFGANAVYTKLSSAAVLGSFVHRLPEQMLGIINAKMFPNIARTAPIEGNVSLRNEAKWYLDFVNPKEFAIDVKDIILTGETRLSKEMDTHLPGQHIPIVDLFAADGHQILKSTVKRATFNAALNYQMDWYQRNGVDATHPLILESARQVAWQRASYEIFQDNSKNQTKVKEYFNQLERSGILNRNKPDGWSKIQGNAQYSAAALYHFFIPINTVPVNILKRVGLGLKLPATYLEAIKKNKSVRDGILNMTAEESDAILLQLKKGQVSAAYWTLGFVLAGSMAGGLYTNMYSDKEREKDAVTPTADYLNFLGLDIPKNVQHNTQFQSLQMGATWGMVYNHYIDDKGESQLMSIFAASAATGGVAAKEHPVISTVSNLLDATKTPGGNTKWVKDLRRRIGVQKVQDVFGLMGYDIGSDSEDFSPKK